MTGPIGAARDDFHAALIAHTIAAVNGEKGKIPPLAKFLPRWDQMHEEAAHGDD